MAVRIIKGIPLFAIFLIFLSCLIRSSQQIYLIEALNSRYSEKRPNGCEEKASSLPFPIFLSCLIRVLSIYLLSFETLGIRKKDKWAVRIKCSSCPFPYFLSCLNRVLSILI